MRFLLDSNTVNYILRALSFPDPITSENEEVSTLDITFADVWVGCDGLLFWLEEFSSFVLQVSD